MEEGGCCKPALAQDCGRRDGASRASDAKQQDGGSNDGDEEGQDGAERDAKVKARPRTDQGGGHQDEHTLCDVRQARPAGPAQPGRQLSGRARLRLGLRRLLQVGLRLPIAVWSRH